MSKQSITIPVDCTKNGMYLRQSRAEGTFADGSKMEICTLFGNGLLYVGIGEAQYTIGVREVVEAIVALHESKPALEDGRAGRSKKGAAA